MPIWVGDRGWLYRVGFIGLIGIYRTPTYLAYSAKKITLKALNTPTH